jgi:ATP-dependent Clp protease adaptor protein ClpS
MIRHLVGRLRSVRAVGTAGDLTTRNWTLSVSFRMSSDDDKRPETKRQEGLAIKERPKTKRPPMFKVLLHNDDYTTKEFVVMVLQSIFHLGEVDANQVMLHVHNNGVGVAGVYPYEIAETKIAKTLQLARRYEYPLQLSMEPE